MLSYALKWLNISSGCSSTRKLHKSGVKVVTGMARRRLHVCAQNIDDWFDCSDGASGALRSEATESSLIHGGAMLSQRWKLRVPSHIFMSTHGDPVEFVFTTDSLFFATAAPKFALRSLCTSQMSNWFQSFSLVRYSHILEHVKALPRRARGQKGRGKKRQKEIRAKNGK